MSDNFNRMIQLVSEFFDTRNDPDQISVSPEEREKLEAIHPDTMTEVANENGPIVWILLVPTTHIIMEQFISGAITEKQLLDQTPLNTAYEALYLCSATVLTEFQRQGLAKKAVLSGISNIRKDRPIKTLFYWPFSNEGRKLAQSVAATLDMELLEHT